ncbi:cytochrome c-type biogenesis protein CcmH [Gammaproteobacteria bacterium]|nr:cytochrome c-type biogenesis protein CcmH [Gammaproteobacteria bacterium]
MRRWLIVFMLMSAIGGAQAAIEIRQFPDAASEAQYRELIAELRCLVCQNNNLADSDAGLALDLRERVYAMTIEGQDREQIVDFMVERYGDFVLYRPPFSARTVLLWAGPGLLLLIGLFIVFRFARRARDTSPADDGDSTQRARDLLDDKPGD